MQLEREAGVARAGFAFCATGQLKGIELGDEWDHICVLERSLWQLY